MRGLEYPVRWSSWAQEYQNCAQRREESYEGATGQLAKIWLLGSERAVVPLQKSFLRL